MKVQKFHNDSRIAGLVGFWLVNVSGRYLRKDHMWNVKNPE